MAIMLSSFFGLFFLLALIKIFHKLWWIPTRIEYFMASQGIRGPSYRFVLGNAKEIHNMLKEAMSKPMSLSDAHNIFHKVQPNQEYWADMYGKNYLQWLGTQPQLVITELELIKEVLNNKNRVYLKSGAQRFVKQLFGDGLVVTEGEKWDKLRKLANHFFHAENLTSMVPAMISSVEMMLERWKNYEGKEIEVFEEFRVLTSDVISKTAFGSSYLEGKKIFDMLRRLTFIVTMSFFKIKLPIISKFTKDEIESDMLEREISNSIMVMAKKREDKVMSGEEDNYGRDLLGGLMKAHHDADRKKQISMGDLITEVRSFYFAGQETTNSLLAWTVLLLAIHTDWQEEARKEAVNSFGEHNPTSDGISRLKVISQIINESTRLYPPVVGFSRHVEEEVRLGNLNLPAKMGLIISNLPLHLDPQIWGEDVLEFKPERFSEGVVKATNNNPAAYFPFGMGPRTCVGMNFALIEAKIALSMILRRYSFTLSPAYVHSPNAFITLQPQHGIQVVLQPL